MTFNPEYPCRPCLPGRKLLVLQNPGRSSRNYIEGICSALRGLGIDYCTLELQEVWSNQIEPAELVRRMSQVLIGQHIGAVLGYGFNGVADMPPDAGLLPGLRSFFEIRGVPHLMLWLDHPQWHAELVGLTPELQGIFRSANCHHFFKSRAHAREMEDMLGWPNCVEMFPGVDPEQFPVVPQKPEFDLVAVCTDGGSIPAWLQSFVELDAPDPRAIRQVILQQVRAALAQLWKEQVPEGMRAEVAVLGERWAQLKAEYPDLAAHRHWPALTEEFPGTAWFLRMAYPVYMNALRILWRIREWERRFYLAYLARHFRVGAFGADWSAMGIGPPGGRWVDFLQQSAAYGRGRVALNITDGHDEEGLTLKPFEIAASGTALLHYRVAGLEKCFVEDKEVAVFESPREARAKLDYLLDHPDERQRMAEAARRRVLHDHTWRQRVVEMFRHARLPMESFQAKPPVRQPPRHAEMQTA